MGSRTYRELVDASWRRGAARIAIEVVVLASCLAGVGACISCAGAGSTAPGPNSDTTRTADGLVTSLRRAPGWASIGRDGAGERRELLEALTSVAKDRPEVVRQAIVAYLTEEGSERHVDMWSKVYILNRIMFAVPQSEQIGKVEYFGGWVGAPHDTVHWNLLWPVGIDDGVMRIDGDFSGYFGPEYRAIAEFDRFQGMYGLRNIASLRTAQ
jgi:hypothetical protein